MLRLPSARRTEAPGDAPGAFSGRVVSATSGQGVPSAELTFAGPTGAASTRTDDAGTFRFMPDREGLWQLASVRAESFLPFGPEWGQSPILDLQLHRGPLERESGAPLTVVDPEGRFTVEGLAPGTYTLRVAAHGLAPAALPVEVAPAATEAGPVEITLAPGVRLEGQVVKTGGGGPIAGARVQEEVWGVRRKIQV